jgi:spermidine synthase
VIRPLTSHKPNLDAFFIGGGGYTFPRYLEATLPASHVVVAEIDPGVTQVARDMLGLMGDTRIETRDIDARIFMTWYSQPDSYDLIFGDAFNDYSVPFHLTTLEFDGLVDSLLRDDGLYVVNIIDGGQRGHFMRAYVRTLQQVFRHVAVIPSGPDWKSPSRTTFVIVASQQPYNLGNMVLKDAVLTEAELAQYMSLDQPLVLTDDHVPVDNLLAPVFADSHRS